MARGRFISNSLGDSERFSILQDARHQVAFVLIITWADAEGRFISDPVTLNGKLFTRLDWTRSTVEAALADLQRVGLVSLYEVDGKQYGVVERFHEHNTITRKSDGTPSREAASQLPPPPEFGAVPVQSLRGHSTVSAEDQHSAPEVRPEQGLAVPSEAIAHQLRSDSAATAPKVEVEDEVQVQVEEKEEHSSPDGSDVEPPARRAIPKRKKLKASLTLEDLARKHPDLAVLVDVWHEHCGELSRWDRVDDDRLRKLEQLVEQFGDSAADRLRDATLEVANDPKRFYALGGYGLENLLVKGKVLNRSDAWRNRERNQRRSAESDPLQQYKDLGL